MNLVEKDEMTTLRTAAESKQTAETAEVDIQLKAVAYAINEAANTGEYKVIFKGVLFPEVKSELESNGYELKDCGLAYPDRQTLISWK